LRYLDIFENLQIDLERHTEMLSEMIEADNVNKLLENESTIINQTQIGMKILNNLLNAANDWNVRDLFTLIR
jgi:CTP-dependent riboflavin kinase